MIIGAGFGGPAAAVELRRRAVQVTLLEKADRVGRVWRDNSYPGAACDVPSSLYSYSFAPNPEWRRRYAEQPDILGYIEAIADREGLTGLEPLPRTVAWPTAETSSCASYDAQLPSFVRALTCQVASVTSIPVCTRRATTNWPGQVREYRERTRTLVPSDYRLSAAPDPERVG